MRTDKQLEFDKEDNATDKKYYFVPLKMVSNHENDKITYEVDIKLILKVYAIAKEGYRKVEKWNIVNWL